MAPPAMAVQRIPDPSGFSSPRSSMANVNMVGNMMELNSPTLNIETIAITPVVDMEMATIKTAPNANPPKTLPGDRTLVK